MLRSTLIKLLPLFVILALLGLGNPSALAAGWTFQVEFSGTKLTVDANNTTLGALLNEIHEKTGTTFILDEEASRKTVFLAFQGLPLETAIHRILRELDHTMVFRPDGALEKVIVTGESRKRSSAGENQRGSAPSTLRPLAEASVLREDRNVTSAPFVDPATQMSVPQRNPLEQVVGSKRPESPTADKMQITTPSDEMVVESGSNVRMEISGASTPMLIEDGAGQGMKITSP